MVNWYPKDKKELENQIKEFIKNPVKEDIDNINGLIVPHAGYIFSGKIAGKVYSFVKNKGFKKAIILGSSHYSLFRGVVSVGEIKTPLGQAKITKNKFSGAGYEHSIDNQIPFLQYLGINEILPLVIGEISIEEAEKLADFIIKQKTKETLIVVSTDLSHFLDYKTAAERDKNTIKIIEELKINRFYEIDACGKLPLLVLMEICAKKNWKPKLIEYKNSGDITGDKSKVVGYAGFVF